MTGANGGSLPEAPASSSSDADALDRYIAANQDRYSPDALLASLVAAGHDREAAQAALRRAEARREAGPTKSRARRVVVLAYGLVYLVLVAGLLAGPYNYGEGTIGAVILTIVLGIAFAFSAWWVGRRGAPLGFGALIWLPLGLLILIGGACYAATGTPVRFLQQVTNSQPSEGPLDATPAPTQPPP